MKKIDKDSENFMGLLMTAYRYFYIESFLHFNQLKEPFKSNAQIWTELRGALIRALIIMLRGIFEKQKPQFGEVLSIYYLMDIEFKEHEATIEKIRNFGNKVIAHADVKTFRNINELTRPERDGIESLLSRLVEVVNRLKTEYGLEEDYERRFEEIKNKTEDMLRKL